MPAETPYGMFLQERMKDRADISVSGVCGELTSEMVRRFAREGLAHHPAATVILGGTNDLGWSRASQDIMQNLLDMYGQARGSGVRPVGVTVPSIRGFDEHIPRRLELNGMIRAHCEALGMPCVDLFSATAEPATRRLAERYSNDGLHLTTAGYELLATMLFEQVFQRMPIFFEGG
jgi:lysophospholipase L1-like esterase